MLTFLNIISRPAAVIIKKTRSHSNIHDERDIHDLALNSIDGSTLSTEILEGFDLRRRNSIRDFVLNWTHKGDDSETLRNEH